MDRRNNLLRIYSALLKAFGHQGWWPASSRFEVMVGAILTQNTAWTNVEKAIANLRREGLLNLKRLDKIPHRRLAKLIRPAGYFNIKAKRLKSFICFLKESSRGNLDRLFRIPLDRLRHRLLAVHGVGPETADSILLYAGGKPIFVIDAYTKRFLIRHKLARGKPSYDEMQDLFMKNLPRSVELFKDYHAQIVQLGKTYCRKTPRCLSCPLRDFKPQGFFSSI